MHGSIVFIQNSYRTKDKISDHGQPLASNSGESILVGLPLPYFISSVPIAFHNQPDQSVIWQYTVCYFQMYFSNTSVFYYNSSMLYLTNLITIPFTFTKAQCTYCILRNLVLINLFKKSTSHSIDNDMNEINH